MHESVTAAGLIASQADDEAVYPHSLLGYRVWAVVDDGLCSIGKGRVRWLPGNNHAYCHITVCHDAPQRNCECGIYSFHRLEQAREAAEAWRNRGFEHLVVGAVACRGQVHVHHDGFRAHEAAILGLAEIEGRGSDAQDLKAVAERYGVPLCDIEDLKAHARRYAQPVPAGLVPTTPELKASKGGPPSQVSLWLLIFIGFSLAVVIVAVVNIAGHGVP